MEKVLVSFLLKVDKYLPDGFALKHSAAVKTWLNTRIIVYFLGAYQAVRNSFSENFESKFVGQILVDFQ